MTLVLDLSLVLVVEGIDLPLVHRLVVGKLAELVLQVKDLLVREVYGHRPMPGRLSDPHPPSLFLPRI